MNLQKKLYQSPIGPLTIIANDKAVTGVHFGDLTEISFLQKVVCNNVYQTENSCDEAIQSLLSETIHQLTQYFAGQRKEFDLPLEPNGTDFQKRVWANLLKIPYGETRSYRQIAEMSNCPKGFRAVGLANNRNPIVIIIPCHRVIGSDGSLTGFGGGMGSKEFLLGLEGVILR